MPLDEFMCVFVCLFLGPRFIALCEIMLWYGMAVSMMLLCFVLSVCGRFCLDVGVLLFLFWLVFAVATAHFFFCSFFFYFVDAHYNFTAIVFPWCKLIHLAYGHTYTYVYRHRQRVYNVTIPIWLSLLQYKQNRLSDRKFSSWASHDEWRWTGSQSFWPYSWLL